MTTLIQILTPGSNSVIIDTLSQKTKVGICTPDNQGPKRPLSNVVFLCPSKTHAAFCRMYSVMVGCIGQPLKRLAGSLAGSANPIQSTAQRFAPMGGGLSPYQGVTDMTSHTQKPAETSQAPANHGFKINPPRRVSLTELIKKQNEERGLEPLPLESDLLLKRIAQGGHSGQFLADAFISAYRTHLPFTHSLGELNKLDCEGFRLFHEILHIRHIPGWNDEALYKIDQQIKAIQGGEL